LLSAEWVFCDYGQIVLLCFNNISARSTYNADRPENEKTANKFEHIRHINNVLGLFVPTLTTPLELLNQEV